MKLTNKWLAGLTLAFLGGPVFAQEPAPVEVAVNIIAQPMADALNDWARQTGFQLIFPENGATAMLVAPTVVGTFTPQAALQRLLARSGLEYEFIDSRTVAIRGPRGVGSGAAPEAGLGRPLVLAQASPALQDNSPAGAADPGSLHGRVSEASSGSPVSGALIRVLETGQTTTTDELGYFNFAEIPSGEYTLSISYIGFAEQVWRSAPDWSAGVQQYVLEKSAWELSEVTVFGTRSARAKALNLQRTADNTSSVISTDLLGNFTDANLAEALRRAPGIAFQRDAKTGDGTHVIVRGLQPEMNAVKLNGLNLPAQGGTRRTPSLNNLLAESVEKITINQTLLPRHESAGTGGLIEIETKSPLSRPHRFASASIESGHKGGGFGEDISVSGTVSGTFGAERNFGLSASLQYLDRDTQSFRYGAGAFPGPYLPQNGPGMPPFFTPDFIDPRRSFPFEPGAATLYGDRLQSAVTDLQLTTRALTLSGEWQASAATNLRMDLQRSDQVESSFDRFVTVDFPTRYMPLPVASLAGEVRQALAWDGTGSLSQNYSLTHNRKSVTDSVSLRGKTRKGRWEHSTLLGYARGSDLLPSGVSFRLAFRNQRLAAIAPGLIAAQATDPGENRIVSVFGSHTGHGFMLPLFSDLGWDTFNDPGEYNFTDGTKTASKGHNDRYTGEFATKLDLNGEHVKYVEVGAHFESAKFVSRSNNVSIDAMAEFVDDPDGGHMEFPALDAVGLDSFSPLGLGEIGVRGGAFEFARRGQVEAFVANLDVLASQPGSPIALTSHEDFFLQNEDALRENDFATYLQTRVDFGKLSFIGGVRVNRALVRATNGSFPEFTDANGIPDFAFAQEFTRVVTEEATQIDVLPRLQLNYRQTDNLIFRGGYFLTVARPSLSDLSSLQSISLDLSEFAGGGPNFDQPLLSISEGNPDLKPSLTHNYDLAIEYYDRHIGLIKVSGYYKQIENFLQNNVTSGSFELLEGVALPDHEHFRNLPENLAVQGTRPMNSDTPAKSWGFEVAVERQFASLPGFWGGFGVYANYAYNRSSNTPLIPWFFSPIIDGDGNFVGYESANIRIGDVPFFTQPRHSGTGALTYSRGGWDSALTYSWQAKQQGGFTSHDLGADVNGFNTLDLRLSRQLKAFSGRYSVHFEGADLLRETSDPDNEEIIGGLNGVADFVLGGSFFGGRTLRIGFSASF